MQEFSSFKDKDAQIFIEDNTCYRKINKSYFKNYDKLITCGLYEELTSKKELISHQEIEKNENFITIKPEQIFITYPWEWCFSQLKDAALLTLDIQLKALKYDMSLKDANFFNIQFLDNKPIFIDTTSFEEYNEGEGWIAYQQFCENFIAPLALTSYVDLSFLKSLNLNFNGIDLKYTSKLLPFKSYFNLGLLIHLHLHSKAQDKYSTLNKKMNFRKVSKKELICLIENLKDCILSLKLKNYKTQWEKYYDFTNYSKNSLDEKYKIIEEFREIINPKLTFDFGANTGYFSQIFAKDENKVISSDFDVLAIEKNYLNVKTNKEKNIFPIVFDIAKPSASVGFLNQERKNLLERVKNVDLSLALALIHHLYITEKIPFEYMAEFFSKISKFLIVEFIEKEDSQIQKMTLNSKIDLSEYTEENFTEKFSEFYKTIKQVKIPNTKRSLFLMEKK